MFLNVLGYPKNNRHLVEASLTSVTSSQTVTEETDVPAVEEQEDTTLKKLVEEHVLSFNPNISHYRYLRPLAWQGLPGHITF